VQLNNSHGSLVENFSTANGLFCLKRAPVNIENKCASCPHVAHGPDITRGAYMQFILLFTQQL
jgi:hypothetical protein